MEYKISSHCVFNINYHIVFTPKRRKAVLVGDIARDLKQNILETAAKVKIKIEAMEIMPDHVHLFVSSSPSIAPHKIVKRIKGNSSHFLRQKYSQLLKLPTLWNHAYYCGTVGQVSESVVKNYIESQKSK